MLKTPPIGVEGTFGIRTPFTLPNKLLKVTAHRTFSDLIASGVDPLEQLYLPVGLTTTDYQNDAATEGVMVVVFVDTDGIPYHIPNTYIETYPEAAIVPHDWVVAHVSLGTLPQTYDLASAAIAIKESVSDYTGVEPNVYFSKKPTSDVITEPVAKQFEDIRQAAIVNRESSYYRLQQALDENARLRAENDQLIAMLNP